MTDVARDWATIGKGPYSQLRSILLFFADCWCSAKRQCTASKVLAQTEFGFQIVPVCLIWRWVRKTVQGPSSLQRAMKLQFRTRRLSRCPMMFVPMATQLAQNSRRDGLARGLFNSVPMPTKLEWLRWSIEPGSSKQSERSFFRYRGRVVLGPK